MGWAGPGCCTPMIPGCRLARARAGRRRLLRVCGSAPRRRAPVVPLRTPGRGPALRRPQERRSHGRGVRGGRVQRARRGAVVAPAYLGEQARCMQFTADTPARGVRIPYPLLPVAPGPGRAHRAGEPRGHRRRAANRPLDDGPAGTASALACHPDGNQYAQKRRAARLRHRQYERHRLGRLTRSHQRHGACGGRAFGTTSPRGPARRTTSHLRHEQPPCSW